MLLVEDIFQPPSGNRRTPSTSTVARCLRKAAMIEAESAVHAEQLLQGEVGGSAFTRQVHVDSCQPDKKNVRQKTSKLSAVVSSAPPIVRELSSPFPLRIK